MRARRPTGSGVTRRSLNGFVVQVAGVRFGGSRARLTARRGPRGQSLGQRRFRRVTTARIDTEECAHHPADLPFCQSRRNDQAGDITAQRHEQRHRRRASDRGTRAPRSRSERQAAPSPVPAPPASPPFRLAGRSSTSTRILFFADTIACGTHPAPELRAFHAAFNSRRVRASAPRLRLPLRGLPAAMYSPGSMTVRASPARSAPPQAAPSVGSGTGRAGRSSPTSGSPRTGAPHIPPFGPLHRRRTRLHLPDRRQLAHYVAQVSGERIAAHYRDRRIDPAVLAADTPPIPPFHNSNGAPARRRIPLPAIPSGGRAPRVAGRRIPLPRYCCERIAQPSGVQGHLRGERHHQRRREAPREQRATTCGSTFTARDSTYRMRRLHRRRRPTARPTHQGTRLRLAGVLRVPAARLRRVLRCGDGGDAGTGDHASRK